MGQDRIWHMNLAPYIGSIHWLLVGLLTSLGLVLIAISDSAQAGGVAAAKLGHGK